MKAERIAVRPLRRILALTLAAVLFLLAVPLLLTPEQAQALDYSAMEAKLNKWKYDYCRTFMSMALKDYYDSGVLPSITVAQAYFESGCSNSYLSLIGNNQFGIKAGSSWDGMVYDSGARVVYNSYADMVNILGKEEASKASIWRAYSSWEESVADHSALLMKSRYAPVLNAADYQEAARQLVSCGYCNDEAYAENLIKCIENYGLAQLDHVTADENGIFGLIMDRSRVELAAGETLQLQASAYPQPSQQPRLTWESSDTDVATVDQNGTVTAKANGYALITATYGDREACCIVCVDSNAFIIIPSGSSSPAVFAKPDTDSNSLGKLLGGQPVHLNSKTVYDSEDGSDYYAVTARNSAGNLVSGYINVKYICNVGQVKLSIGTPETILHVDVGAQRRIPIEIYAEELQNKTLSWSSSSPLVVQVDRDGNIKALSEGVSIITVSIDGTKALSVTVYVGSAAYELLVASANVNLRESPNAGATILGLIRPGDEVKLILDSGDGWYHIIATIDGLPTEGYSYSRYFKRPGDEPDVSDPPDASSDTPSHDHSDTSSEPPFITVTYRTGVVQVDDALNVRDKPGMSGKRIARLRNNTQVVILEPDIRVDSEKDYKVWYHISFTDKDKKMEGYVSVEFVRLTGTVTERVPLENPISDRYEIDDEYVTRIPAGCVLADFRAKFAYEIRVFRADGMELAEKDKLFTGDVIHITFQDGVQSRLAVVSGDATGDGSVTAADYMLVRRAFFDLAPLEGARLRAVTMSDRQTIAATDYLKIKRAVIFGTVLT